MPAGALGADLRQARTKRDGTHLGDERLGLRQQRTDGLVVAEGNFGGRWCRRASADHRSRRPS
jgi:hypothetical protein